MLTATCGDYYELDAGEVCDESMLFYDDGVYGTICQDYCQTLADGYYIHYNDPVTGYDGYYVDYYPIGCGDGTVTEANGEYCDDGNYVNFDGCTACQIDSDNYKCINAGQNCMYYPKCGNFELDDQEECDDGNRVDNDGCDSLCQFESISTLTCNTFGGKYTCVTTDNCGDGLALG